MYFFFFKQKTAYEMRISDWSSDVCSSDLLNGIRKVTEELSSEYGRTILEGGEVLINVRGTLGGCAVVPPELKGYNIAREVAVIPVHTEIDSAFLLNVIASPYFQDRVDENLRGIAYEGLNLGDRKSK